MGRCSSCYLSLSLFVPIRFIYFHIDPHLCKSCLMRHSLVPVFEVRDCRVVLHTWRCLRCGIDLMPTGAAPDRAELWVHGVSTPIFASDRESSEYALPAGSLACRALQIGAADELRFRHARFDLLEPGKELHLGNGAFQPLLESAAPEFFIESCPSL